MTTIGQAMGIGPLGGGNVIFKRKFRWNFTGLWSRKPLPLVLQRQGAKRATAGSETAPCPLG
jgi:hypothetical protein